MNKYNKINPLLTTKIRQMHFYIKEVINDLVFPLGMEKEELPGKIEDVKGIKDKVDYMLDTLLDIQLELYKEESGKEE